MLSRSSDLSVDSLENLQFYHETNLTAANYIKKKSSPIITTLNIMNTILGIFKQRCLILRKKFTKVYYFSKTLKYNNKKELE